MIVFNPFDGHDTATRRAPQRGADGHPARLPRKLLLLGLVAGAAHAQQPDETREVIVNGKRVPACSNPAQARSKGIDYACLNHQVQEAAAAGQVTPSAADAVTSQANTPSRVGTFSFSATSERMGRNFGHSAQPYRPPAPDYSNTVTAGRPK